MKDINDLPASARSLPDGAKRIFVAARDSGANEAQAWSAVRRVYHKDGSAWVPNGRPTVELQETLLLDEADLKITGDGYLVATPRVARTGIQEYRGWEVGKPDVSVVKVYRPETEVFSQDSASSFAHRPVTLGHPKELVTAQNWKELSIGQTGGDIIRDGQFIRISMSVMDAVGIKKINRGAKQISAGYVAELVDEKGTTDDGQPYDMVQTNIRVNHVAFVAAARGGSQLVIGDAEPEEVRPMSTKTVLVDGIKLEVPETAAAVIERTLERSTQAVNDAQTKFSDAEKRLGELQTQLADSRKETETVKGQVAVLEKQVKDAEITPDKLDTLVKARSAVLDKAKAIVGDKLIVDGKSDMDIRRQTVAIHLGDDAIVKAMSDEAVSGAFMALKAPAGSGQSTTTLADYLSQTAKPTFTGSATRVNDAGQKAWEDRGRKLRDAWKQPNA
jgi:hypothetical protein